MFYFLTIFIPAGILLTYYFVNKPKGIRQYVDLFFKASPALIGYGFFLYFLENEHYIDTSWTSYTVLLFVLPATALALLLKFFLWAKWKK